MVEYFLRGLPLFIGLVFLVLVGPTLVGWLMLSLKDRLEDKPDWVEGPVLLECWLAGASCFVALILLVVLFQIVRLGGAPQG